MYKSREQNTTKAQSVIHLIINMAPYYNKRKAASNSKNNQLPAEEESSPPTSLPKIPSHQLLLLSSFRLNRSCSKLVNVGFIWSDGPMELVVRITDANHRGVTFSIESWNLFCNEIHQILSYLDNNSGECNIDGIDHPNFRLHFTTSYGERALLIEQPSTDTSPTIVLKKVSFERLVGLIACVRARIMFLGKYINSVEMCKNQILSFVCDKISDYQFNNTTVNDASLLLMRIHEPELKDFVLTKMIEHAPTKDPIDNEVVLYEFLSMFIDDIVNLARKTV